MVNFSKRDLKKLKNRLEFLYTRLGGVKKDNLNDSDKFLTLQKNFGEKLIFLRKKIREKDRDLKKKNDFILQTKLRNNIKEKISECEEILKEMERCKNTKKKNISKKILENRENIIEKFKSILNQLENSIKEKKEKPKIKNLTKISDMKKKIFSKKKKINNLINFSDDSDTSESEISLKSKKKKNSQKKKNKKRK